MMNLELRRGMSKMNVLTKGWLSLFLLGIILLLSSPTKNELNSAKAGIILGCALVMIDLLFMNIFKIKILKEMND